jgi:hypothetical protein
VPLENIITLWRLQAHISGKVSGMDGIFCLEGEWDGRLTDRASVEPYLRVLSAVDCCGDLIHRDVATRDELAYYLDKWLDQRYAAFPLAYLAFHGSPAAICLGRDEVTLGELAAMIDGRAGGRTFYFGSCQTMKAADVDLRAFCRKTGARAIVGYTAMVDWTESAAFDFLLIPELLSSTQLKLVLPRLRKKHLWLVDSLESPHGDRDLGHLSGQYAHARRVSRDAFHTERTKLQPDGR